MKVKKDYNLRIPKHYVDIHCQNINPTDDADNKSVRQSLREKVWDWLFDPHQRKWRYLQLLGDFGIGKTTFCFYLGQEIISTMLSFNVKIIELGTENLDLKKKLKIIETEDREKTILMLDAYDEYRKRGRAESEFLELQDLTQDFFKVIVTSRTNYFACAEAELNLDTQYVSYLNEEQVIQFFKMNYGFLWKKYWYMLARYQQLSELSRRVIVLNYLNKDILKSIQAYEKKGVEINNYKIYEKIVTNILAIVKERNADDLLPPSHALEIMSLLGFYIICYNSETQIHYELLGKKLLQLITKFQLAELEMAKYLRKEELLDSYSHLVAEIRTRTFLVRDNAGYYRFAHRSFAEYFAARFILEVLPKTNISKGETKFKMTPMVWKFISEANRPETLVQLIDLMASYVFRKRGTHLSVNDVKTLIKKYNFYDRIYNPGGKGYSHHYLLKNIAGDEVSFDFCAGLMWQQGGSSESLVYEKAEEFIKRINKKGWAGYHDWRLPTIEEAMSLMELDQKNGNLHIDPVFDNAQKWIWTADRVQGESLAWVVNFDDGSCDDSYFGDEEFVRAVRSG